MDLHTAKSEVRALSMKVGDLLLTNADVEVEAEDNEEPTPPPTSDSTSTQSTEKPDASVAEVGPDAVSEVPVVSVADKKKKK